MIREASVDDAERIAYLLGELGFSRSAEQVCDQLQHMPGMVLVALHAELVVGVASLNIMQVLHRPQAVGRVSALVVDAKVRGQGIGRALLNAAEVLLRSRGCGMLEITSNFQLESAHAFYRAQNYQETSYRFKKDL